MKGCSAALGLIVGAFYRGVGGDSFVGFAFSEDRS